MQELNLKIDEFSFQKDNAIYGIVGLSDVC